MTDAPAQPTVLVADDEPALLGLIERIVGRAGYRVLTAPDGHAALERIRAADGAVVAAILDLTLPPSGGVALLRELRSEQPGVPVVLVSGGTLDAETREILHGCGGAFVSKPFSPGALMRALDEVRGGATA